MCVYYVEIMCAGKIGLGWAHDVFIIACHMLVHFPCIRTILFSILLILICAWYFFSCLSLSPSLSIQLVCSMAPKKNKSTLSQNPLRSRAFTFDSTPSHVRFHDDKARTDFLENFSRRDIHSECQVVLSNFSNIDLHTVIYNRGW